MGGDGRALHRAVNDLARHEVWEVDYAVGVATDDMDAQDEAVDNLSNVYVPEFSALLAGATGLPQDTVAALTGAHVLATKDVVDAQAAEDFAIAPPGREASPCLALGLFGTAHAGLFAALVSYEREWNRGLPPLTQIGGGAL